MSLQSFLEHTSAIGAKELKTRLWIRQAKKPLETKVRSCKVNISLLLKSHHHHQHHYLCFYIMVCEDGIELEDTWEIFVMLVCMKSLVRTCPDFHGGV